MLLKYCFKKYVEKSCSLVCGELYLAGWMDGSSVGMGDTPSIWANVSWANLEGFYLLHVSLDWQVNSFQDSVKEASKRASPTDSISVRSNNSNSIPSSVLALLFEACEQKVQMKGLVFKVVENTKPYKHYCTSPHDVPRMSLTTLLPPTLPPIVHILRGSYITINSKLLDVLANEVYYQAF